jgi:UDP-N-acetylglucosamine 2-epimerase
MHLPINYGNIKIKPFKFLEINKKRYSNIKKLNQIIILSQGNIGNKLAQLVLNKFELFKNLKIIYKIHPGEYDRYKKYTALNKLINIHNNIEIIENMDLHKLLAMSKYQLGVNSTAILEGIEFGCRTILFDISGVEYMTKFIKFYDLVKINNMYMSEDSIKYFKL